MIRFGIHALAHRYLKMHAYVDPSVCQALQLAAGSCRVSARVLSVSGMLCRQNCFQCCAVPQVQLGRLDKASLLSLSVADESLTAAPPAQLWSMPPILPGIFASWDDY